MKHFVSFFIIFSIFLFIFVLLFWIRDIITEGEIGLHNSMVRYYLSLGFYCLLFSEAMFFWRFFWILFDGSITPSPFLGISWPSYGAIEMEAMGIPLINTILLVFRGVLCNSGFYFFLSGKNGFWFWSLGNLLGIIFFSLQGYEYFVSFLSMSDSIYGGVFYSITGLHGAHVLLGIIWLGICLFRLFSSRYTFSLSQGLWSSLVYWHFVDVIWIFVWSCLYFRSS